MVRLEEESHVTITDRALSANGAVCKWGSWSSHTTNADNINDGTETTYINNTSSLVSRPVVHCDLNDVPTIMGVGIHDSYNNTNFAISAKVWSSSNNTDWTERWSGDCPSNAWEVTITPTAARYWMVECTARDGPTWVVRTLHLFEDSYVAPQPPDGATLAELQQKIATQYPQLAVTWALLQGAPTNCDPALMLACIGLWNNWLLNQIIEGGTGGGECLYVEPDPNNQGLYDQADANLTTLSGAIDDLETLMNNEYLAIIGGDARSLTDVYDRIASCEATLSALVEAVAPDLKGAGGYNLTHIHDDLQSGISAIAANDNANTLAIRGLPGTNLRSILDTMTSSFTTQTNELRGPLGTTHDNLLSALAGVQSDTDDIQNTLSTLPSNSGVLRLWPGFDQVTMGAPVMVNAPTELNVNCHGVLVTVQGYPPGQSRQPAGAAVRFKGLGWLAFRSDLDDYGDLQSIQFDDCVIMCNGIAQAEGLAVYCKPGAILSIQPFTINGL